LGRCVKGGFGTRVSLIRTGTMGYYAYLGPLGEVVRHRASFIASKDGFLIGTYERSGRLWRSLRGKEELKPPKSK